MEIIEDKRGEAVDKLIYCQNDIPKEQWRYGLRSSAATGCGWIATYNALRLMGYTPSPEKLIKFYERQLPLIHGNTGTFILAPALFFRKTGFSVNVTANRKEFDRIAADSDVCIMYYWWRKGLKAGSHFVALQDTPTGFVGYNTYRRSTGPDRYGRSIDAFLKKKGYFGAILTGIKDREKT